MRSTARIRKKFFPTCSKDLIAQFAAQVKKGDVILCGENFGCGSSREHPAVGFAYAGIKAILVKSVSRIFFRSSINQGLPILVLPEAVNAYKTGDRVEIDMAGGVVSIGEQKFHFNPLAG